MADNWYIVLDLEFDPPVEDETIILNRINDKAKFWSSHFNDFKMGAVYKTYHKNISTIKQDMIGESNIRAKLASEACTIVYGPLDKLIKTIGRKGVINSDEANKISKNLKVDLSVVVKRIAKYGIKYIDHTDYHETYEKYYKNKPQNAASFTCLEKMLETFNVDNLYDFLYANTPTKNGKDLPAARLCQKAKDKKANEFYKHDSVSSNGSKLCSQCEITFKDENSKKIYDDYLNYKRRTAILDDAKNIAYISGVLRREEEDECIGKLTQILKDRNLAVNILVAFCEVEHISYSPLEEEKTNKKIKVCRCGCINDVSDGRKVCSNCGLELEIVCPKCKAVNDANVKVCKCGFRFENIDKAIALCTQAEQAIDSLDFDIAKNFLDDADSFWPNNSKGKAIRERLVTFKSRVGNEVEKMNNAIKNKRYFEADTQYKKIKALFPGYSDPSKEETIKQSIAKAKVLFNKAKTAKTEKEILDYCSQAYDYCVDLPGVKELIPAPSAVPAMTISVNENTRINTVSWSSTADKSIKYIVVKSSNGWIEHITDGEIVYRGSASSFSDSDINAGITYYYNVFAQRAGVTSKASKGVSAVNLFEVSNVSIVAANSTLNITWDRLPKNATAEIYEVLPNSSQRLIATSTSNSHLISGLTNGKTYSYRVLLSYMVNGKKNVTKGVIKSAVPDSPPEPIDFIKINTIDENNFEAVWYDNGTGSVKLFCSPLKPKYDFGDIISLSELERNMRPVQALPISGKTKMNLKAGEKGVGFKYSGNELLYVAAVVVKSGSAVFGKVARVSKDEKVNIKSIRPVNGKIHIYLDLPKDATGFVVLHRFDKFPEDISDVNTVRDYIPVKQYNLNNAIVLDDPEDKKYYFSVFAEFRRDGEKDYSAGEDYLFDNSAKQNITYSIDVSNKLFSKKAVTLKFTADSGNFELPSIDVMYAVGNTPIFKESSELLYSIPAQQVEGSLSVKIPLDSKLDKDTYIKAFFKDNSANLKNQLLLKVKSSYKIS